MFKNHPKGLPVLFFSEMWERFCYYGMRVLLILYLTKSLIKGDIEAFAIYGAYTALVYAAPVLGGKIADKVIGYKNAVILGGILMAIGEFFILGGTETWLYVGMGAIIVGNGYFKANISSIVGKLYTDDEPSKRDAGFTIFYIGINIGALLSTLICAEVGEKFGFQYGFALAGLGMIIGVITFVLGQDKFKEHTAPPDPEKLNSPWIGPLTRFHVTILGSIASVSFIPITSGTTVSGESTYQGRKNLSIKRRSTKIIAKIYNNLRTKRLFNNLFIILKFLIKVRWNLLIIISLFVFLQSCSFHQFKYIN